jgi:transketolase
MRMIPGVTVLAPQSPDEIRAASKAMLAHEGPVYMRIGNPPIPELWEGEREFTIGKGQIFREGTDLAILSTGSVTGAAIEAAELLAAQGITATVIGLPTVCPLDEELVLAAARKTGRILTVEEHYAHGGLGTMVAELCAENAPVPIRMHGVPKEYATSGSYEELLQYYKLDAGGVAEVALGFLGR